MEPLDIQGRSACQNKFSDSQLSDVVNHFYVTHTVDMLSITEYILFYTLHYIKYIHFIPYLSVCELIQAVAGRGRGAAVPFLSLSPLWSSEHINVPLWAFGQNMSLFISLKQCRYSAIILSV